MKGERKGAKGQTEGLEGRREGMEGWTEWRERGAEEVMKAEGGDGHGEVEEKTTECRGGGGE